MAYDAAINPLTPAASDNVSAGAAEIRNLKTAVVQRIESVFVDVDADPLVFQDDVIGNAAIAPGAIDTDELADGAVEHAKLGLAAVEPENVAATGRFVFEEVEVTSEFEQSAGRVVGHRTVSAGGDVTIDLETTNHHRHNFTANGAIDFSNWVDGQLLLLELAVGANGVTIALNGVIWPDNNTVPTFSNVSGRKDVVMLVRANTQTLAFVIGQNLPSSS